MQTALVFSKKLLGTHPALLQLLESKKEQVK